ncbi:transcription cofactor vestigial 4 [Pelobates cultripes]|uniref:Transcription cofactor vestigial 4 n=1 Tax=Pelobates cultripes TaxID=61616 RepID=A0AAD1T7Q9_PELCU|nr:transcription cofactor vestigial 4 [Pelobates cultripes]
MAVSSLQYTMGISSGFKVYILEGQHSMRDTDRLRPFSNHAIPVYPIKRKHSPEPPQLRKRVHPASNQYRGKVASSPVNVKSTVRQHPTITSTPKSLGPIISLENVLKHLMPERRLLEKETVIHQDDQPLALVKRLEKPISPIMLQQNRPSVITCISKSKPMLPVLAEEANPLKDSKNQISSRIADVEEHFQRSLMSCKPRPSLRPPSPGTPLTAQSTNISVEDHFSKALGSKWFLIRAAADSPSSPTKRSRHQAL